MQIKRIDQTESHLVTGLFDKYRVFYKKESDLAVAEYFIQQRLSNNESVIFVALAEVNGTIVPAGFTQLYPIYSSVRVVKNWLLNDLYVEAGFRKQGIGESLVKKAMEFAKADGATFVELSTATDNYTAQSLYEQIGFRQTDPDTAFYTYRVSLG